MVNVAKDRPLHDPELPASARQDRELVTGLSLPQVVQVLAALDVPACATPADLATVERAITRAELLDQVGDACPHHLLAVSAEGLVALEESGLDPLGRAAEGGAAALVVTGGARTGDVQRWSALAAGHGLPVLLLAHTTPERVVTAVLAAVLDQQSAILERVEQAHEILVGIVLAGGGLEDLCQRLAGFLGGAAMVTTSDGRVLARAGTTDEVEAALALDCFDRTGRLITEREPVGIRPPHSDTAGRAMVRIVAGALDHGLLAAFVRGRELTADDVHLLERAATVAALAITKEQAVSAVESKYRAEFLRDALAGRAGTVPEAIAHADSLGWDIDRRMVVVVAETDEDDAHTTRSPDEVSSLQHRFARAWGQAVGVRDPKAPVMGFSQEVVALLAVPDGADTEAIMRTVGEVVRVVSGDGGGGRRTFSTGVSRPIASAGDLPQAYDEALNAVSVGRQMHGDSAVTHFDGLGIFRLLALIPDSRDLRRFVDEALGDLATDDAPENADLRRTLAILIDTNMNVAETARLLFFHYNTLRYRIAKLEKMLGPFTTDPQLRLTLALALKVQQMKGI
jgi:PucR family transcriptional regulator, purine catabolism regulatory protein